MPEQYVRVPKMGMSTVEVDVVDVSVAQGDVVAEDDPIAEVESEKAVFVIRAVTAGTVTQVFVKVGDVVEVGTPVCKIESAT